MQTEAPPVSYGAGTAAASPDPVTAYPFLRPLVAAGIAAGAGSGLLFGDLLLGAILLVGIASAGLLWRRSEIPIFAFCVVYQWLFVGVGYIYMRWTGSYPGIRFLGDLDTAIWYSLAGLLAVTFGIRIALRRFHQATAADTEQYEISKLFWIVLILFSMNWVTELTVVQLRLTAFNVAQILHHLLVLRYLFLYLLILAIVQQGRHYWVGILAFSYVLLPELTSSMTKFKELFFLLMVVILSQWRPFSSDPFEKVRNRQIIGTTATITVLLLVIGLVWTGGMKHSWRSALLSGQVAGSPIDKIEAYGQHAIDSIENFDPGRSALTLASRLSSGVAYFSHVLRVVPDVVPHEDGALTMRAVRHVLMPRFLFPEKPDLGGDSWLVRKYARLNVSGEESGTSIGLGYMAEFYIDYGFPLMLIPLLLYGALLGTLYRVLARVSPSPQVFAAVSAGLFLQHFLSYEGNFTKLLGGTLQNFIILALALAIFGARVHGLLSRPRGSDAGEGAGRSPTMAEAGR